MRFGVPTPRIPVKAGLHTVGVTFLATNYAPDNNLNQPFCAPRSRRAASRASRSFPTSASSGSRDRTMPRAPPTRRAAARFSCAARRSAKDEEACARTILSTLARRAFRRPATAQDVGTLMEFYREGRKEGNFDAGIEAALQRLLADPEFVYRRETEPANLAPGRSYRISDLALASRLSFFLWSSIPDDELMTLAAQGSSRIRRCSSSRCGGCWRIRARRRWSPTSRGSG